ncbi:hypothetical protein ACFVFQ_31725 [Streptomyces sp. NPDC057743]|uniref:hypothetical protein n=1 Tax=Streptomyces sp. NPDC057743 TaxID=3346236 RepID=UPI0036B60BFB
MLKRQPIQMEVRSTMSRYVVVNPDGNMDIREAALQELRQMVNPYGGDTSDFVIHRAFGPNAGMRGLVADTAGLAKDRYPPNHLAGRLIDALGGPDRYWFGSLAICGYRLGIDGELLLCGLSDSQRHLITQVYSAVHEQA